MLSSVSPVITGADAASPQPTSPLSASIRTSTLSARRTSSPAMMTGLIIGRLTAIGSIDLMRTVNHLCLFAAAPAIVLRDGGRDCVRPALKFRDTSLIDDVPEHVDFFGYARPGGVSALRPHLEAGFVQLFFHVRQYRGS